MITPLINKLQNCQDKFELASIYSEILVEYENLYFPTEEFKRMAKGVLTSSIDFFISEFDVNRKNNIQFLESLKLFDIPNVNEM